MHIKRFEATELEAALARIREELGPDALILERRRNPDGPGIVVLAAAPRTTPGEAAVMTAPRPAPVPVRAAATPAATPSPTKTVAGAEARLASDPAVRAEYLARLVRSDHFSTMPLALRELYLELVDAEVDSSLVFQILQRLGQSPRPGQFTPAHPETVLTFLRSLIKTGGTLRAEDGPRVLALVGPTGVGKTTTAAKLAGQAAFALGRKVALVSTDSYRIFGAQHLASYAALMGLPFETVATGFELRALLEGRLAEADLVLVDTSGRSPRDPEGIREMGELLAGHPLAEVHLVLAANGRVRDLGLALESFSALPLRGLLFTKLDESTTRGGIFSTALKARLPVSYLGTGQEVPDDLVPATPLALTEGMLEDFIEADRRHG